MRLYQTLRDGQPQPHSGGVPVHADKILKDLLMMLRRDSRAGVRHANFHTVGTRQAEPPAFFDRGQSSHAALPEMRPRTKGHAAPGRSVLQRIIEKIGRRLLHFLVIETKRRYGGVNTHFQFDALALESLEPAFG